MNNGKASNTFTHTRNSSFAPNGWFIPYILYYMNHNSLSCKQQIGLDVQCIVTNIIYTYMHIAQKERVEIGNKVSYRARIG